MDTLYVVHKSGGSYVDEDEYSCPVVASHDRSKCEQYVKEHSEESELFIALSSKYNELYGEMLEKDPYGGDFKCELKDRPRWPSGLKEKEITQEMRDERKRIDDENRLILDEHSAKVAAHEERRMLRVAEFVKKFIDENNVPEKWHGLYGDHFVEYDKNRRFSISTLPMI